MISHSVGIIVASMAVVSIVIAVGLGEKTIRKSGNYPLTKLEKEFVLSSGFDEDDLKLLQLSIDNLPIE